MDVLNRLLEISIYSGVIFIVTMLLKTVFKHKMSPFLHFAVWSVFLLRLIIPVTFESPVHLSFLPAEAVTTAGAVQSTASAADDFNFATTAPVSDAEVQQPVHMESTAAMTQAPSGEQPAAAAIQPVQPVQLTLPQILLIIWLGGVLVGLIYSCRACRFVEKKDRPPSVSAFQPP